MNASRRGFLGLIGGGAVAGPSAIKKAVAKASDMEAVNAFGYSTLPQPEPVNKTCAEAGGDWRAQDILNMLESRNQPARMSKHTEWFADIHALRSVSPTHKAQMQRQKSVEMELAYSVREFVRERKLNWVGLTEEQILKLLKRAASAS